MNLHIIQEGIFTEAFYNNIKTFGLLSNNAFYVRHSNYSTGRIDKTIPSGTLDQLENKIGSTKYFQRVFIHQLSPLYYGWINKHQFNELNWLVWGADLYNLPFVAQSLYEPITLRKYVKRNWLVEQFLYNAKYALFNKKHKIGCYSKIDRVLTWMKGEYDFARKAIPELRATHDFFLYENKVPYSEVESLKKQIYKREGKLKLIIGNSSTPSNNHLDAIQLLIDKDVKADIILPVSYGEKKYIRFMKRELADYKNGTVSFLEDFMPIHDYLKLLQTADGLVMNSIRPQGYGNIFMMMLMNKPVFLNPNNLSLIDLDHYQIEWKSIKDIKSFFENSSVVNSDQKGLLNLVSRDNLELTYNNLFAS